MERVESQRLGSHTAAPWLLLHRSNRYQLSLYHDLLVVKSIEDVHTDQMILDLINRNTKMTKFWSHCCSWNNITVCKGHCHTSHFQSCNSLLWMGRWSPEHQVMIGPVSVQGITSEAHKHFHMPSQFRVIYLKKYSFRIWAKAKEWEQFVAI